MANRDYDDVKQRRRVLQLMGMTGLLTVLPLGELLAGEYQFASVTTKAPPKPARKPTPPRILMLDPGHGGKDPGAISHRGTEEKDVVLDICKELADKLSGVRGITVKLTRERDVFVPLRDRVKKSQEAHADLFISVHADSAPDADARGMSAYTLSEKASDDFARAIAKQENIADLIGGVPLEEEDENVAAILMDLAARHTKNASLQVKHKIVTGAGRQWPLLENPMRAANFAVLRAPDVPSVLLETGFLSNKRDEEILRDHKNRMKIAQILARELATILNNAPFV